MTFARSRAFARALARVGALVLAFELLAPVEAQAAQGWYWKRKGARKVWGVSLELGVRYETHYNRAYMITTAPESIVGEIHMTFWNRNNFGLYAVFGKSIMRAETTIMGGGVKLPFFNATSGGGVSGLSMMLVGDLIQYTTVDPVPPQVYTPSQLTVRYGGAIHFRFGKTGLFLDTTMMIHSVSDNFFIAPMVGIGYHF